MVDGEEETMKLLYPIYEFRPIENRNYLRYANGRWIEDDGKYDLAFIGKHGYACVLYFRLPYYKNILWSWCKNGDWGAPVKKHPNRNAWHYMLRANSKSWGDHWDARQDHPNIAIGEKAMNKCCELYRCANGGGPELRINDPYIEAGLVRDSETKQILKFPKIFNCMDCGKIDWRKEEG